MPEALRKPPGEDKQKPEHLFHHEYAPAIWSQIREELGGKVTVVWTPGSGGCAMQAIQDRSVRGSLMHRRPWVQQGSSWLRRAVHGFDVRAPCLQDECPCLLIGLNSVHVELLAYFIDCGVAKAMQVCASG